MAYATGTATSASDLWTKLLAFLTTNSTLVAAGQNWSTVWSASATEVLLKGPGLAGADSVYVGLKRTDNTLTLNESLIWLTGATGHTTGATEFTGHPNSLSRTPAMFLDNAASMGYWFIANGRRFIVVTKMSTVYNSLYAGLFLPYAIPTAYPYPMFIGGSRGFSSASSVTGYPQPTTWRAAESGRYSSFAYPQGIGTGSTQYADTQAAFLRPDAIWGGLTTGTDTGAYLPVNFVGPRVFPRYTGSDTSDTSDTRYDLPRDITPVRFGTQTVRNRLAPGLDGEYPLAPITLMSWTPNTGLNPVTYGVLDGVHSASVVGAAAETQVSIGGVNHLIVPNIQRTLATEYFAVALE